MEQDPEISPKGSLPQPPIGTQSTTNNDKDKPEKKDTGWAPDDSKVQCPNCGENVKPLVEPHYDKLKQKPDDNKTILTNSKVTLVENENPSCFACCKCCCRKKKKSKGDVTYYAQVCPECGNNLAYMFV